MGNSAGQLKAVAEFDLFDVETVELILRGDSVIDWHRLNLESERQAVELLEAMEYRLSESADRESLARIKGEAESFLRRHLDFSIPDPVERATVSELLLIASGEGHRQLCACTILKVMHIMHHVESRELLFSLPMSMQDVFKLVEEKVYRVVGGMLATGFPIAEFVGGRKNKDSLYTKLLSKPETTAANVYDRIRFRIVTRGPDDILPIILYLSKTVFPFNQVIPNQSLNTLFHIKSYFSQFEKLRHMIPALQLEANDALTPTDNTFSGSSFKAVHFVADVPVRLQPTLIESLPSRVRALGPVCSVLCEFQIVDRESELASELGDGSHAAYKNRQKNAVMSRLKLGTPG